MKKYTTHQAKTYLSKLIKEAISGEQVVITNRDEPLVELKIYKSKKRNLGFLEGKVEISKDFDEPLGDFKDY